MSKTKGLIDYINEARRKKEPSDDFVTVGGKVVPAENVEADKLKGKKAKTTPTRGTYGLDEPVNDANLEDIDLTNLDHNKKMLLMKFKTGEDFFIRGKAGWGKTSIIKAFAKKFKLSIITVYLDKAVATDLGGIPVPMKGAKNSVVQEIAIPGWANIMLENPDKQYLLFFDEMNQAAGDVQNALMPIVLEHEVCGIKFDNFFVGAAGNFSSENDYLTELSEPLTSRFAPIIEWETGDEESWKSTFVHLHKVWDDRLGKTFVDLFEKDAVLFKNPREVEHKIFKFVEKLIASGDNDMFEPADYHNRLLGLIRKEPELERTERTKLERLSQDIYTYVLAGGKPAAEEKPSRSRKNKQLMVSQQMLDVVKDFMEQGYWEDPSETDEDGVNIKWGVSRENIAYQLDPNQINAEMLERIIDKLEADGVKFRYETVKQFEKDGYREDPEDKKKRLGKK